MKVSESGLLLESGVWLHPYIDKCALANYKSQPPNILCGFKFPMCNSGSMNGSGIA